MLVKTDFVGRTKKALVRVEVEIEVEVEVERKMAKRHLGGTCGGAVAMCGLRPQQLCVGKIELKKQQPCLLLHCCFHHRQHQQQEQQ